jgi:diguanylate cyclase (GGDEF)-like protein
MLPAPLPEDEAARLRALHSLTILDTAPDEHFDRITRIAKRLFDVPTALVSLVDAERQWFKSRLGLEASETPRDISFCGHAITGEDPLVVRDALEDPRFHDNPLVTGDPKIRFYAGYPISAPDGHAVGTLCVIDTKPRDVGSEELAYLADLGRMLEDELRALAMATTDVLTGLSNRRGFVAVATHILAVCRRANTKGTLILFDLDDFKPINDRFGHGEGDHALRAFADLMRDCFRDSDIIARLGGDEFCVLLTGASTEESEFAFARFDAAIHHLNALPASRYPIAYSVGVVAYDPELDEGPESLLQRADDLMYRQKRDKRRRSAIA